MMPESAAVDKRKFLSHRCHAMLSHMKRTTLQIDPALYTELRKRAAAEQRTLTEVIERTLRMGLSAGATIRRAPIALPSYDLGPFLADPTRPGRLPRPEESDE